MRTPVSLDASGPVSGTFQSYSSWLPHRRSARSHGATSRSSPAGKESSNETARADMKRRELMLLLGGAITAYKGRANSLRADASAPHSIASAMSV
jgi:hypothetical protein